MPRTNGSTKPKRPMGGNLKPKRPTGNDIKPRCPPGGEGNGLQAQAITDTERAARAGR